MHWFELTTNPQVVGHIYGAEIPSLDYAVLTQYTWENGPASSLVTAFQLAKFPDSPPTKWVKNGCNVVLLKLRWIEIRSLSFATGSNLPAAKFQLTRDAENLVGLTYSNSSGSLNIKSTFLYIDSFSAHIDSSLPS